MPGQLQDGTTIKTANVKDGRAYAEGYLARTVAVSPTNPHASGSNAYIAFAAGATAKAGEATLDADKGSCAPVGITAAIAVPDVVGDNEATATATLEGDDFVVVTPCTALGSNVRTQVPAAAAVANVGDTVNIYLIATVPDISTENEATAIASLATAGLLPGTITGTGNGGTVSAQDPAAAVEVDCGTTVDFTLTV